MSQKKRLKWEPEDDRMLMGLWPVVGSVYLIAIMLNRTRSSVQTRASRLNLPPREEDSNKHRRRWTDNDDKILAALIEELSDAEGNVLIQGLADRIGRSVDAIASRLEELYGEASEMMGRLRAPPMPPLAPPSADKPKSAKNKQGEKTCLRCRKSFWSDGSHNWICPSCKRREVNDDYGFD